MKKYFRIMRLDHWIKQFFIVPGCIAAMVMTNTSFSVSLVLRFVLGFAATCLIASSNYVINEWLDSGSDKYHPTKKYRSVVTEGINPKAVLSEWGILAAAGIILSFFVNRAFLLMSVWLWSMGIVYNVKPVRSKDIPLLDVLSESVNNAIRLLMGWFIVSAVTLPPSTLTLGYWMAGAFLMSAKRFAEYRMINDKELAGKYRKSFRYYSEHSLLISTFFYAICSVFFLGVFLIKYRIELVLIILPLIGLYCYYLNLAFSTDSAIQKPEKLFREKGLMLYCLILVAAFAFLMTVDIPSLVFLTDSRLLSMPDWLR